MAFTLDRFDLDAFVAATLAEDLGALGDVTSVAVIPAEARFAGVMRSRENIVAAGLPVAEEFFRALDPEVELVRLVEDGTAVEAGGILLRAGGAARALLTAEREHRLGSTIARAIGSGSAALFKTETADRPAYVAMLHGDLAGGNFASRLPQPLKQSIEKHGLRNSHLLSGGAEVTPQQCEALLRSATDSCDLYYQAFQFVVWAGKSAADALSQVMFETVGEA